MTRLLGSAVLLLIALGCSPATGRPTAQPSPTGEPRPSSPAAKSPAPTTEPTAEEPAPPAARLILPDGSEAVGALGSFVYDGAALDSPWLPARVLPLLEVPAGAKLELRLAQPVQFVSWGVRYAAAADEEAEIISPLASGGDGTSALDRASFGGLPSGDWVLTVQLFFADELGDAAYYWHVIVP